jgi:hypothetical protein
MAGRNAIRTLASLVYTIDDSVLVGLRKRAEELSEEKFRAGVYVTHLGWLHWKHCADYLSELVSRDPDLPVPREFSTNPRYAHELATRKAVARLLADRWQDKHDIRPERRVDTADGTR